MADSNLDSIVRQIDAIVASIDFAMPGRDQSLGRDLAGIVAEGIIDRTVADRRSADGGTLKPNAPRYAAYKARKYKVDQPLVRTGQMLSLESVLGKPAISSDQVELRYGTGKPPDRAATGAELTDSDRSVTDVEKAYLTSKERPFYGLDGKIADEVVAEAAKAVAEHVAKS